MSEGFFANFGNKVWNIDMSQTRAVEKGKIANLKECFREFYIFQKRAAAESGVFNLGNT